MLETAGADRMLALDLHAAQIQGFFDVPVDHLFSSPVMIEYFRSIDQGKTIVVSPDAGGVERARAFAKRLEVPLAIIDKRRDGPNVAEMMHIIGEVEGGDCLIVDDLIDTAGTLVKGGEALIEAGARSVTPAPLTLYYRARRWSGSRVEHQGSGFHGLHPIARRGASLRQNQRPVGGPLLARAIQSIHEETSVSTLFV